MSQLVIQWLLIGANSLAMVALAIVIFRRQPQSGVEQLRPDIERLERTIQTNDTTSFQNAETRAEAMRKEVADSIQRLSDQLTKSVDLVGQAQKAQLDTFEKTLANQGASVDQRLAQFADLQTASLSEFSKSNTEAGRALRDEVANRLKSAADELRAASDAAAALQKERLEELSLRIKSLADALAANFDQFKAMTEAKLAELRTETTGQLKALRTENEQKLEQMRATVDEKLQGTLEKRLGESFALVTQQLKQVHEGLGDMQRLATGVGDLKRVLTNVKSRGTWGETQLAAILEDMLAPDQYERNVKVKDGSSETVEFCIKIPRMNEHDAALLLPVDAKFPIEDYERLLACAESGDMAGVEQSAQKLEARFKASAKDIAGKYVCPPRTTEYAVMYVPSEGLYAELVKRPGLASTIVRDFNVVAAGPTNLMSIINAVHAVSRSVTIQQKAGQVAALLLKVQSEFEKYGKAVTAAKKRAESTVSAMEDLDRRQRAMGRALKGIKSIDGLAEDGANPAAIGLVSYPDSKDEDPVGELSDIDLEATEAEAAS